MLAPAECGVAPVARVVAGVVAAYRALLGCPLRICVGPWPNLLPVIVGSWSNAGPVARRSKVRHDACQAPERPVGVL